MPTLTLLEGDNLPILRDMADGAFNLIYADPPYNTGAPVERVLTRAVPDAAAGTRGYRGRGYRREPGATTRFDDRFDDYLGFLEPRLREAHRLLADDGSLFVHLDPRESHYVKVALDTIFGREGFRNEIIWAYDYGGRTRKRWAPKHDTILWYTKHPKRYCYRYDAIDRVPYMAPTLVGPEKAARGKTPTDTWWHTIVPTSGPEKTGYPTQKPLGLMLRVVRVHSKPGDHLLDFFAGSGSFGEAALREGRDVTLIDAGPEALAVMRARLARWVLPR